MPKAPRLALIALVGLLVLALVAPAEAASLSSTRRRRAATRVRRAQLATRLNTLRASDAQLDRAVRALDAGITAQEATAVAADQALQAAETALREAQLRLEATERETARRRRQVIARAVAAYTDPGQGAFGAIVSSENLSVATRKESLLEQVIADDHTVLDRLRAAEEDLSVQRQALDEARRTAAHRRQEASDRLAGLRRARQHQARLRAALQARIAEYAAEADAVARQEAYLVDFIRRRQAAEDAARRAAVRRPRGGRGGGGGGSSDDGGGAPSATGFIRPVRGPVTSGFGYRWGRLHAGIDISASVGTPIRAAKAGTVITAGTMSGYGNVIVIDHGGGITTLYAHQSRLAAGDGESVSQGEVIGYVGMTGNTTGPHLHFEVRVGGTPRNPMSYL